MILTMALLAGMTISVTAALLGFSLTRASRAYSDKCNKQMASSEWQLCGRKCLVVRKVNGEGLDWFKLTERYSNSDNHSVQLW